jgi:plastocyanin
MNKTLVMVAATLAVTVTLTASSQAGTISGKLSGVTGTSAVYVDTIAGKSFPAPEQHPVINQKGLQVLPHISVVQVGSTVDFLNSDKVAHNVFWPNVQSGGKKGPGHNLGTWPQGDKRSFKFDQAGVASILCNVHPEMSGYLVIVPTPYFAQTDASGTYKIENVPDGQYTVTAWHEGSKTQSKPVAVSGDAKADFTLSK